MYRGSVFIQANNLRLFPLIPLQTEVLVSKCLMTLYIGIHLGPFYLALEEWKAVCRKKTCFQEINRSHLLIQNPAH